MLDRNLTAAAISKKPITTFTELSQPPDLGNVCRMRGTVARIKNGSANTVEKTSMPRSGIFQFPCAVETRIVPMKGDVHVNDVSVNVKPIKRAPMYALPLPSSARVNLSSFVSKDDGTAIS